MTTLMEAGRSRTMYKTGPPAPPKTERGGVTQRPSIKYKTASELRRAFPQPQKQASAGRRVLAARSSVMSALRRTGGVLQDEQTKMEKLRFPLLGPTREETSLFHRYQRKKGRNCEEIARRRTTYQPSANSSPPWTPQHNPRAATIRQLASRQPIEAPSSTISIADDVSVKAPASNAASSNLSIRLPVIDVINDSFPLQNSIARSTRREKTIDPSPYGYHPRSHSPTYKKLVQCRQKLEELIDTQLRDIKRLCETNEDLKSLSPKQYYDLYVAPPERLQDFYSNSGKNSSQDFIPIDTDRPKIDVELDSTRIKIRLRLPSVHDIPKTVDVVPSVDDILRDIHTPNVSSQSDDGKKRRKTKVSSKRKKSLNNKLSVTLPNLDEKNKVSDDELPRGKPEIEKRESHSGGSHQENLEPDDDTENIDSGDKSGSSDKLPSILKTDEKVKTNRKKSPADEVEQENIDTTETSEKKNIKKKKQQPKQGAKRGFKPLRTNELIYDKREAKAVTRVAESHGLTEEEANELYLSRDSRLVSQKYIDRLNQMAFGSDESDLSGEEDLS